MRRGEGEGKCVGAAANPIRPSGHVGATCNGGMAVGSGLARVLLRVSWMHHPEGTFSLEEELDLEVKD